MGDAVLKGFPSLKRNYWHQRLNKSMKVKKDILPFVTQYQPSVQNIKQALMKNWHSIHNQPLLREIFKEPSIISFKERKILKRYTR